VKALLDPVKVLFTQYKYTWLSAISTLSRCTTVTYAEKYLLLQLEVNQLEVKICCHVTVTQ